MQLNKTKQKKIYKMEKIYKKIFRDLKISLIFLYLLQ